MDAREVIDTVSENDFQRRGEPAWANDGTTRLDCEIAWPGKS